ncbi:hypothetical protein Nepgr_009585 [Nepenthes gracilis]|uniref:SANT domain-containing protein n=1 Tax=Nepenthes gracilis TaxID=150966 RepID=A0AAD3SAU5_NEPGR|nr:hypothetical protein Nepgr_009585 [Nepenthes gracilis]
MCLKTSRKKTPKMDFIQQGPAVQSFKETSCEQLLSSNCPDTSISYGGPLIHPRVGDEYQVEIPSTLTKTELLQYLKNPADSEIMFDTSHRFIMGLRIPITWVCKKINTIKDERLEYHDNLNNTIYANGSLKFEGSTEITCSSSKKDPDCWPFPGLSSDPWSDFEVDCFLLGLYIFGKDLLQVKRFMESKEIGQVLYFYYGKFYRSAGYYRWSDFQKMKSRKAVNGHRFFTGYRQQELLSRLRPHLSEESINTLQEVSKDFAEGRTTLEVYASTLKSVVGIHALVDAVGIGKKDDLTTLVMECSKSSNRPETLFGHEFSSLTCEDIIKFLTGAFRCSKARSNDLFWEAVWPRLLARGWHSEQPKSDRYTGLTNCLVFLMPGVHKFSRRKLIRGAHYFDSVADVLKKVASEPELLVLEDEENRIGSSKEANGWVPDALSDNDGFHPDHGRHCYLQPQVTSANASTLKFTIVDTSFVHGEKPSMVRELRNLPVEKKSSSSLMIQSEETEVGLRMGLVEEPESTDILLSSLRKTIISSRSKCRSNGGTRKRRMQRDRSDPQRTSASLFTDEQSRIIKHRFSHQMKTSECGHLGPFMKKQRLTACSKEDPMENIPAASFLGRGESYCVLSLPVVDKKAASKAKRSQKKLPSVKPSTSMNPEENSCKESSSVKYTDVTDTSISMKTYEKPLERQLIDLNFLQGPIEVPEIFEAIGALNSCQVSEQQLTAEGTIRHSKRNRPMSTKALEALESSFLNLMPSKRCSSTWRTRDETSRHSWRSSSKSSISSNGVMADSVKSEERMSNGIYVKKRDG